ncbi:MAG TPA: Crp/Fnr family transcriptional regulator [Phototrophicaceae bacterium]|jgi:CRP-like cAMP-binding protein|nr:Crp/Fnr family transcriptional regulator [Phototrophicaceae bacterium]
MEISNSSALIEQHVRDFALRDHLNPDLLRCLRLFQFPAQVELYSQTGEQKWLYFLVTGKVQVTYYHLNGKESILALLTPLALIGDLELFTQMDIETTVLTAEASTLLGIEKAFALRYGYDDSRFLRFVIQNLTAKLYGSSHIQIQQSLPLISRIAVYLLSQPVMSGEVVTLESVAHLAGLMGTTNRHLNRVVRQLVIEGLITRQKNRVRILNRVGLMKYAES